MPRASRTYSILTTAMLSTMSIIFEIIPSFRVPWGMKIDLVGTMWVLAYFLYGLREALSVSLITTIFILGYSPTTFIGAFMKLIATLPMFLVPAGLMHLRVISERSSRVFGNLHMMAAVCALAISVRLIITFVVNLYWAIPLFWGVTPDVVLDRFGGALLLFVYVANMNLLQGIVDMVIPWVLAYKFRLSRYFGTW